MITFTLLFSKCDCGRCASIALALLASGGHVGGSDVIEKLHELFLSCEQLGERAVRNVTCVKRLGHRVDETGDELEALASENWRRVVEKCEPLF